VSLTAQYVSANLTLEGHITDVSPDGLFFSSDFLDDQGESARVVLVVPARNRPLELRGEVRWVRDQPDAGGMGIRLLDVSREDQELLSRIALEADDDLTPVGERARIPAGLG
jgi:uncharacterized protein (TIGR02266 family)